MRDKKPEEFVKIKEASYKDYKLFDRIQRNDGFKHIHLVYREKMLEYNRRKIGKFWVAWDGEKPVGFTIVTFTKDAICQFLSVAKTHKEKGIEKLLIDKIIEDVKKTGKYFRIKAYAEQIPEIVKLFESVGFKKAGLCVSRFGKNRDAFIMLLKLKTVL